MKDIISIKRIATISTMILVVLFSSQSFAQEFEKTPWVKTDHSGQNWFEATRTETPNYFEVKRLYDAYFAEHPLEKSSQRNMVRRWLSVNKDYIDPKGNVEVDQPTAEDYKKIRKAEKKYLKKKASSTVLRMTLPNATWNDSVGTWRMIGPYHPKSTSDEYDMYGGHNDRVYINPYQPENMFAGQAYGGLWVSQDGGDTWKLTDSEFANGRNLYANRDNYYGPVEAHPMDSTRIVVGTEAGLLVSSNFGDSWTVDPVLNLINMPGERAYYASQKADDLNTMLCTYGRKLYRTTDGGTTWNVVYDNSNGGSNYLQHQHSTKGIYHRGYNFFGVSYHPTDANVVLIGLRNSSNEACIYKSTDGGATFSLNLNTGLTERVKLMLSIADPDHYYISQFFISADVVDPGEGIYKYDMTGNQVAYIPHQGGQGALIDDITVSATDADVWAYGGYASGELWVSDNQGTSWVTNNPGYVNFDNYIHPDIRSLSIVGDTILIGSDGGMHISYDAGVTFEAAGEWISAIDQWGFSSAYKGEILASGDDHGPTEIRTADEDQNWTAIGGADSGEVQVNRCNTDFMYGRDIYTRFRAVRNGDTYKRNSNQLIDAKYEYLTQDPDEYYKFYAIKDNVLLVSEDNMTSADTLHVFNDELTRVLVPLLNNEIFYVLENNISVMKSTDGGATWNNITPSLSVTSGRSNITDIATDETGDNLWLSYGQTQTNCKAVHSADGGGTYTNISTAILPNFAAGEITYQRGTNGMVYLATNGGGVYYRDLSSSDWTILGTGLPMMGYIRTIYTVPDMNKFRMGTSRGSFEHDLPVSSDLLVHFSAPNREGFACEYDTIQFFDYSSYQDNGNVTFTWTFEGATPNSSNEMNPKVQYLTPGLYDVSLTVNDGIGNSETKTMTDFMIITQKECGVSTVPGNTVYNTQNWSYVKAYDLEYDNTTGFTMMGWFKGEGAQRAYAGLLSQEVEESNIHLNLGPSAPDSMEIAYHHEDGQWWWSSGLYLVPDKWTHIAMVVDPTGITLYKDGISSKHSRTINPSTFSEDFLIGSMIGWQGNRSFIGDIDEVAVYKRALTTEEIRLMRHLTKENPQYPAQHDDDLIAYYQFNEDLFDDNVNDQSGNNRHGELRGDIVRRSSNGPFGGGRSAILDVQSSGTYTFTDPCVELEFASGTTPEGPVVATYIENPPNEMPSGKNHDFGYYIVNNYGANSIFSPMTSMSFCNSGTISNETVATDESFKVFKRESNSYTNDYTLVAEHPNISLTAGVTGSVSVDDASVITSFSQFVIQRDNYPIELPKISITSASNAGNPVEGGSSISFYFNGDNQGVRFPVADTMQLAALGTSVNGSILYYEDEKALIVFSDGQWQKLNSVALVNRISVGTGGTEIVTLNESNTSDSSSIFSFGVEGFVIPASLSNSELSNLDYPVQGMTIYNTDESSIQVFNGAKWKNIEMTATNIPVSSAPAAFVEGIHNGPSKEQNAILQDNDKTGAIVFPSIQPESVNNPKEGLVIFEPILGSLLYFNGSFWSEVE